MIASGPIKDRLLDQFRTYEENPRAFGYDNFADPMTTSGRLELAQDQADVIRSVLRGEDCTWRAGHGVGKSTTLAILVFAFLLLRPRSKVGTTAPVFRQVKNLWTEIRKWYERFRYRQYFDIFATEMRMRAAPAEWYAIGLASNKPTNIEGLHGHPGRFLFVVDEAKGVPDPIYDSIDGACSDGGVRLYVSTPGSRFGKFYESHHGRVARFFTRFHTNGETSARVSKKWVAQKREEWGERSSIYIAKVRGEFPQEGDDVMFPLDHVDEAERAFDDIDEHGDPVIKHGGSYAMGGDIARFGFNQTVAVGASVRRMDRLEAWERAGIDATAARFQALCREWQVAVGLPLSVIAIDDSGLGGGVTDILRTARLPVEAVVFGAKPGDSADGIVYFSNKKAEMAQAFRRTLETNWKERQDGKPGSFALLPNDRLKGQLTSIRRRYINKGVLALVDPDDPTIPASELAPGMKVSPDHAHAAILAHYAATQAVALVTSAVHHPDPIAARSHRRTQGRIFGR